MQVRGRSRPEAAQRKHQETDHDDPLAAEPVRRHAVGQLQQPLRQTVNAHGQAQQRGIVTTRVFTRLKGKHRQHQKQTQHAQGKDRRQRKTGAPLGGRHACHREISRR